MQSQAVIPKFVETSENSTVSNIVSFLAGVALLALLAKIIIPLSWTPVPITGQTFGVTLIALLWGRVRAFSIVSCYLLLGTLGLPIFAAVTGGFTSGYLIGMLASAAIIGELADRGWSKSFLKSWAAGALGSVAVFTCGLSVLYYFTSDASSLLTAGLWPFLPGDLIKTVGAAFLASRISKSRA